MHKATDSFVQWHLWFSTPNWAWGYSVEDTIVCVLNTPTVLFPFSFLYLCLYLCSFACVDLDSKACRDELSQCLKSLYSSCFLLSEFDWIIQVFHFARAEVFIAVGPCLRYYTVTTSSLKSLQQTNQFWGRGEAERMTTEEERCEIYAGVVVWRLKQNGTLRPETLTQFSMLLVQELFFFSQNKEKWESEQENVVEKIWIAIYTKWKFQQCLSSSPDEIKGRPDPTLLVDSSWVMDHWQGGGTTSLSKSQRGG